MQWCVDNDFSGASARAIRYDDYDIVWENGLSWLGDSSEYIISEKDRTAMWLSEYLYAGSH